MVSDESKLWELRYGIGQIDPDELKAAIESQIRSNDLDFRSRLLIRDSLNILTSVCGKDSVGSWLNASEFGIGISHICSQDLGEPGFSSLRYRVRHANAHDILLRRLVEDSEQHEAALTHCIARILSRRHENLDDVRYVTRYLPHLKEKLRHRVWQALQECRLGADEIKAAESKWYVLYAEPLPT